LDCTLEQLGARGQRDPWSWGLQLALEPARVARMRQDRRQVGGELLRRDVGAEGSAEVSEQSWRDVGDLPGSVAPKRQHRTAERPLIVVVVRDVRGRDQCRPAAAQLTRVLGDEEELRGPDHRPKVGPGRIHQSMVGQDPLPIEGAIAIPLDRGRWRIGGGP
jgi:hypothetical protein